VWVSFLSVSETLDMVTTKLWQFMKAEPLQKNGNRVDNKIITMINEHFSGIKTEKPLWAPLDSLVIPRALFPAPKPDTDIFLRDKIHRKYQHLT